MRSDVAVGARDWYSVPLHVVREAHARSSPKVGGFAWYSVVVHVVSIVQIRFETVVGAALCHSSE